MVTKSKLPVGDWRKPVRHREFNEQMSQFLDWLTDPDHKGTQIALAAEIGVSAATLTAWKIDPFFVKEWEKRLRSMNVSPERTQLLMDRAYKIAADADKDADSLKGIELYMKLVDRISPQRIAIEVERPLSEMSPEELAEAAMALRGDVIDVDSHRITTGAGILAELAADSYEDEEGD